MPEKLRPPSYVVELVGNIYIPKDLLILSQLFIWQFGTAHPIIEIVEQSKLRVSVHDYAMSKPIGNWLENQKRFFDGLTQLGLIETWHITRMPKWEENTHDFDESLD